MLSDEGTTTVAPPIYGHPPAHAVLCPQQAYCLNKGTCYMLKELGTKFCKWVRQRVNCAVSPCQRATSAVSFCQRSSVFVQMKGIWTLIKWHDAGDNMLPQWWRCHGNRCSSVVAVIFAFYQLILSVRFHILPVAIAFTSSIYWLKLQYIVLIQSWIRCLYEHWQL